MKKVIGLVGFAGSGKDTVGNILRDDYGYKKYSLSTPLKDVLSLLFGWDRSMLEGATKESREWREQPDLWWNDKLDWENKFGTKFTPRICMQFFGTEIVRNHFDDNFWIYYLQRYILSSEDDKIVVTDCRFKNEIDAISSLGADIIRVRRNEDPDCFKEIALMNQNNWENNIAISENYYKLQYGIHESESSWIGYDFKHIIDNTSTIGNLKKHIESIIKGV